MHTSVNIHKVYIFSHKPLYKTRIVRIIIQYSVEYLFKKDMEEHPMKKLITLSLALMLIFAVTACGASSSSAPMPSASAPSSEAPPVAKNIVEEIKAKGKLVMGTEAQYAPFEFKNDKAEIVGCDIWLAEQIAAELGVKLEIVDMSFDGIIPAVQSSQVDIGIAAFTSTEERAQVIDFSSIYQYNEQLLIIHKDDLATYIDTDSLIGKKVGSQKGTIQSQLILKAMPKSELFELAKYPELAMEVMNKNIAGFVVDGEVGLSFVENNDKLAVANFAFNPEDSNFGKACVIKKGNDALTEVVNKVIEKVLADGSFEKAYEDAVELAKTLGV